MCCSLSRLIGIRKVNTILPRAYQRGENLGTAFQCNVKYVIKFVFVNVSWSKVSYIITYNWWCGQINSVEFWGLKNIKLPDPFARKLSQSQSATCQWFGETKFNTIIFLRGLTSFGPYPTFKFYSGEHLFVKGRRLGPENVKKTQRLWLWQRLIKQFSLTF